VKKFLPKERQRQKASTVSDNEIKVMIARGIAIIFVVHIANQDCRRAVIKALQDSFKIRDLEVPGRGRPVQVRVRAHFPKKHCRPLVESLEFVILG
jgi:hypothetical protein